MDYPSVDLVKELFLYKDGALYWRIRPVAHFSSEGRAKAWNNKYPGKLAGTFHKMSKGYRDRSRWKVKIFSCDYLRSIVIWAIHNDMWPPVGFKVDHISRDQTNDKIDNLRLVNDIQSAANRNTPLTNTSGYRGVRLRSSGKWQARIRTNRGQYKGLGTFDSFDEAKDARIAAESKYHSEVFELVKESESNGNES
jgi:hypothetical protein